MLALTTWANGSTDLSSTMTLLQARKSSPAVMLGAPTTAGLPVAISMASSLLRPSSSWTGACGCERHSTMGDVSPFFLMSSPSARSWSGGISGKSSAAGWMAMVSRQDFGICCSLAVWAAKARVEQKAVDCYTQAATVIIPTLIGRPRSRACGRFHVHEGVCNCAKNAFSANTCAWSRLCTQLFVSAELVHFPRERQSSQALVSNADHLLLHFSNFSPKAALS